MGIEYKSFFSKNWESSVAATLFWRGYAFNIIVPKDDAYKYIAIDKDGEVYIYHAKPERRNSIYTPPSGCHPDECEFIAIGYFEEISGETINIKNWRDVKYCKKLDLEKSTEIHFDH